MRLLTAEEILPLTCTREGVCCHGHQIWVNPWEVARLARGLGCSSREVRARWLDCRGTRLAFTGPPDRRGKTACSLYRDDVGCTVHPERPLTCRMYPLGRGRVDGALRYYHPGAELSCYAQCPTVGELPSLSVGDYLAGQAITTGEAATDAYARVIYGLAAVAGTVIKLGGEQVDRPRIEGFLAECATLTREQRAEILPDTWIDLATVPDGLDDNDPARFAEAHGAAITGAIQRAVQQVDGSLTEAAVLHLAIAVHLAPTVGAELDAMRELLQQA